MGEGQQNNTNMIVGASVKVNSDGLSALISVPTPKDSNENYTIEQLDELLKHNNISYGIDRKALQDIVDYRIYNKQIKIATGRPAVEGESGYFTYYFKTKLDNKPKILPDGSVDYRTVDIYEPVTEGQVIATYTEPTKGRDGISVRGQVLKAKDGKTLSPIKGKGFSISEDKLTYTSNLNGKIEMNRDEINITKVLDIKGDVDIASGDIVFDGDVVVKGCVCTGAIIRATGDVTISGNVESAYITAGGNVELKSGMQGGGKGTVECDGCLSGKFFEQAILRVKGNLNANSMMNCDVYVLRDIIVSGRRGIIVGGTTLALGNVEASMIGNMAEVRTVVSVGVTEEMLKEINTLRVKTVDLNNSLSKLKQILKKVDSMGEVDNKVKLVSMRKQVTDTVRALEDELQAVDNTIEDRLDEIAVCSNSKISVNKYIFKGVHAIINGQRLIIDDTYTNVYLKDSGGEVKIINVYD